MSRLQALPWRTLTPHLLVICWITFLAVTIWDHASRSVVPPLYDPLGYLQKGLNFWRNINHGHYANPLNIVPASRPPGSILMSAPFGYPVDLHWFYFRSVFFPIVCVVASVYLAAWKSKELLGNWVIAAITLLFSSLPMFYHFEWLPSMPSPVRFGMVDNFQAGVAALATAAFVRSTINGSLYWMIAGAGMAAFTLLIKPSGGAVMALLFISWTMAASIDWFEARKRAEDSIVLRRYLALGSMLLFVIYSMVIVCCVNSQYLSSEHFSYAKKALATMKEVLAISLSEIPWLFHYSTGEAVLIWIIGIVILFGLFWPHLPNSIVNIRFKMTCFLASALFIWISGAFYWLVVQSGGNQIRYFYPFFFMGIVYLIPLCVDIWQRSGKWLRFVMVVVCFLPAVNMVLLLVQKDPSAVWQKVSGVNVFVGKNQEVVKQAYDFLEMVQRRGENRNVYSFFSGIKAYIFENVGMYEGLVKPNSSTFITRHPIDWVNGFVTRLDEVLSSDYILFEPVKDNFEIQNTMQINHIQNFSDESRAFHAWLTQLTEHEGIKVVSDDAVRLLEITDHRLFERQIERFIAERSWRPEFKEANPQRWWSASDVASYVDKEPAASDIRFGEQYKLHVMALNRVGKKMKIEFWWEKLQHEDYNRNASMFFHFIDSEGRIRSQQQVPFGEYVPIYPDRRWRYGVVKFDPTIDSKVSAVAFGLFYPDSGIQLIADKGMRDWNDRRVVIPITAGDEKN